MRTRSNRITACSVGQFVISKACETYETRAKCIHRAFQMKTISIGYSVWCAMQNRRTMCSENTAQSYRASASKSEGLPAPDKIYGRGTPKNQYLRLKPILERNRLVSPDHSSMRTLTIGHKHHPFRPRSQTVLGFQQGHLTQVLPLRRARLRRHRLQRRPRQSRRLNRHRGRQEDRRPSRLRGLATALGRRALLRLDQLQPQAGEGFRFRGNRRLGRDLPLRRLRHAAHATLTHLQQLGRWGGSETRRNPPFLGRRSQKCSATSRCDCA